LDPECGTEARLADELDGAAVRLDHLSRDPEAEAESAESAAGHGALEALEDPSLIGRIDADAVIADFEHHALPVLGELDFHRLAGAVLHGIADQVVDHLLEPQRVPASGELSFRLHLDPAAGGRELSLESREALAHRRRQIDLLALELEGAGRNARHLEQLPDQFCHPEEKPIRGLHALQRLFTTRSGFGSLEPMEKVLDMERERRQRRA